MLRDNGSCSPTKAGKSPIPHSPAMVIVYVGVAKMGTEQPGWEPNEVFPGGAEFMGQLLSFKGGTILETLRAAGLGHC